MPSGQPPGRRRYENLAGESPATTQNQNLPTGGRPGRVWDPSPRGRC